MLGTVIFAVLAAGKGDGVLSAQEVFARASPGVGVVVAGDRLGSAVAVSGNRVVTNWHVVERSTTKPLPRVRIGELEFAAVLVGMDADQDLAILQLLKGALKTVPPRRLDLPVVGERVFTIGSPKGLANSFADGLVSNIQKLKKGTLVQTTAAISHGSSGGGLFDARGQLVGITTLALTEGQQLNFAVPVLAVEGVLKSLFTQPAVAECVSGLSFEERALLTNSLSKHENERLRSLLRLPSADAVQEGFSDGDPVPMEEALAPAAQTKKMTKPEQWANSGWAVFRWGMGPGDVAERLLAKDGEFLARVPLKCIVSDTRVRSIDCSLFEDDHSFQVLGVRPSLFFDFFEGELRHCHVLFSFRGPEDEAETMFRALRDKLRAKYGKPTDDDEPAPTKYSFRKGSAEWNAPALSVELETVLLTGRSKVSLSYGDPVRSLRWKNAPMPNSASSK